MLNRTILEFGKEEAFLPEKKLAVGLGMRPSTGGRAGRSVWVEPTA